MRKLKKYLCKGNKIILKKHEGQMEELIHMIKENCLDVPCEKTFVEWLRS